MPGEPVNSLEEVVRDLPDAVIVLDSQKKITGWLGAAERLFGWNEQEVLGSDINECLKPRDENGNRGCIGPCEPGRLLSIVKRMPEYEVLTSTKDGGELWVGLSCSFDRGSNGRVGRLVVVARDASKRKRIDLEKSEVISAVSHELRSPLTSVKGFTSTLLNKWDRFDDDTKKHLLATINSDADRVTRLLGELLDVSRIEAGRLQLRRQLLGIDEVAERVVSRIQPQSEEHVLKLNLPPQLPEVFADPDKVEQVLTNVLENAVKYTDRGVVEVTGAADGDHVLVSVADQGEGIPEEQRQSVFGKFFRRLGDRRDNPTGTGLGLYISKGLVEAHGGRMWVDEAPGGGAQFTFTLPTSGPDAVR
jgi:PAS domain S-box-containing protein